jgi:hypothetical protein
MRRSCFYMNQRFTQRHLNAIRSPLLTGYVNMTGVSMTQAHMSNAVFQGTSTLSELIESANAAVSNASGGSLLATGGGSLEACNLVCMTALHSFRPMRELATELVLSTKLWSTQPRVSAV